jgi:hypothetical protein
LRNLDTDGSGGQRVVAHRAHLSSQRGVHHEQAEGQRHREHDELDVIEEVVVAQVHEGQFRCGDAGDPLGAAGDVRVGHPVRERERKAERHDAEIVRLHPQRRHAHEQAHRRRDEDGEQGGGPESEPGPGRQDRGGVGPDTGERDLGEVDLPRDPHHEPESNSEDREQDDDVRHVDHVRVEPVRQQPGARGESDGARNARAQRAAASNAQLHARFTVLSPKMPVGRIMMITVNTTNVTSSE